METSQIALNNGLLFLAISTGVIFLVVGGFLVKLIIDLSKLTQNLDETTTVVKKEIEPTLKELKQALTSINAIAQNADQKVDSLSKFFENMLGAGSIALIKAKHLSGGLIKGLIKGGFSVFKMFLKK